MLAKLLLSLMKCLEHSNLIVLSRMTAPLSNFVFPLWFPDRKNYRMIRFFSRYFCCLQRCNLLNIESKKIFWTFGAEVEKVLRRSMMWSAAVAMRRYCSACSQKPLVVLVDIVMPRDEALQVVDERRLLPDQEVKREPVNLGKVTGKH